MTAQKGAELWKTYLEPLRAQGIRLGSPAPSNAPSGKIWLQDFFTACAGGCTVDFIALRKFSFLFNAAHLLSRSSPDWYSINATRFIAYLEDFHNTFNLPIWVTEWACHDFSGRDEQCSYEEVVLFLNETQSFMDRTEWVERYSWFGAMRTMRDVNPSNALLGENGALSDLGRQYIGEINATTTLNSSSTDNGNDGPRTGGRQGPRFHNGGAQINVGWLTVVAGVAFGSMMI